MDASNDAAVGRATLAQVTLRLIPFMFLLDIIAFLDRVNVGVAVRHARSLEAVEEVISPVTVPGASDTLAGG